MQLSRARWPELASGPLVLVPLGSTEQHGPHLPFGTDTSVAEAVALAVADRVGAVLAPAVPYGSSGEHQDFPGTVSIGREALAAVLRELARSMRTWAGRVALVNGHGGNTPVLASIVPSLRGEGHDLAWLPCVVPNGDAHAGRTETSLQLYLDPGAVRIQAAEAGVRRPIADLLPELVARGVRAVAPNGVLGDPAGASAEEGGQLLTDMATCAQRRITAWAVEGSGCLSDPERRG